MKSSEQIYQQYGLDERDLGEYKILTGRFNFDLDIGYVNEWHIVRWLFSHTIHTFIIHGGNGLGAIEHYYVLMEPRRT